MAVVSPSLDYAPLNAGRAFLLYKPISKLKEKILREEKFPSRHRSIRMVFLMLVISSQHVNVFDA